MDIRYRKGKDCNDNGLGKSTRKIRTQINSLVKGGKEDSAELATIQASSTVTTMTKLEKSGELSPYARLGSTKGKRTDLWIGRLAGLGC